MNELEIHPKDPLTDAPSWAPTASLKNLQKRAELYADIRQFFSERNVLEVETPVLCQHTVTDVHIESFETPYINDFLEKKYYLQTSPEYAMKRLFAAYRIPIYQICKAFRNGEHGSLHNPEFSLLEWYQPGYNHHDLMDEVEELLQYVLATPQASRVTYQELFIQVLQIDPFSCSLETLKKYASEYHFSNVDKIFDRDLLLQFLFSHVIEPNLGRNTPVFVYDFPASQAALSALNPDDERIAERFELFIDGMELANGFHELLSSNEQRCRFQTDLKKRAEQGRFLPRIDERLLSALYHGLPPCAGVALGIDRLLMIKCQASRIQEVVSFPWDIA